MASLSHVKLYFDQWLQTATGGKVVPHWAFVTNRLQLKCNVCEAMLTTKQPESSTDIDYGIQEFVKIHAHTGDPCDHMLNGSSAWLEIPHTGSWQCQKCKMWMHGDAPPPKAVTLDFKTVTTGNTNLTPSPFGPKYADTTGKIDCKPASAAIIAKQMDEYNKTMEVKSLELELKVKKIQLEAAKQTLEHTKNGTADLIEQGLITAEQQKALFDKAEQLQAELLEQEKAKAMALENVLKIKMLQDKLGKAKMEFHDTGHIPNVAPEPPVMPLPKTKPLKIATGRKFR